MRNLARVVSWVSLAGTIAPSVLLMAGYLDLDQVKLWMLLSTAAWFIATPFWMDTKEGA